MNGKGSCSAYPKRVKGNISFPSGHNKKNMN